MRLLQQGHFTAPELIAAIRWPTAERAVITWAWPANLRHFFSIHQPCRRPWLGRYLRYVHTGVLSVASFCGRNTGQRFRRISRKRAGRRTDAGVRPRRLAYEP